MKTSINLLPKYLRKIRQRSMRMRALIVQGVFWTLIPVGVIVMLWAMMTATNIQRDGLIAAAKTMQQSYDIAALGRDEAVFRNTNIALGRIANMDKSSTTPSRTISQIAQNFPANMRLDKLTIDDDLVEVRGVAGDRTAVLELAEKLEQEKCFADVVTPLASIVQKEDVSFAINFQITKECL